MEKTTGRQRLMTLSELAYYCGKSNRTILRWIRQGKLNYENGLRKLPDGDMRIDSVVWSARLRALVAPLIAVWRIIPLHHAAMVIFLHSAHLIMAPRLI